MPKSWTKASSPVFADGVHVEGASPETPVVTGGEAEIPVGPSTPSGGEERDKFTAPSEGELSPGDGGSGLGDGDTALGDGASPPGGGDTPGDLPGNDSAVADDLEELTARAAQADEYLALAQRTKADFENYRKRAMREAQAAQERGVAKLAKELLPAVDNLDRALSAARAASPDAVQENPGETESQLVSGIKLVHAEVLAALARAGIEQFSPEGEPFDPQYHEAVAQQPVDGRPAGTVVEVYQCGYRTGESVLRPARVLVAA
ncbi:MAG: nucleotide exchange factor GrpE [Solirubrobacteraceae bacterium]